MNDEPMSVATTTPAPPRDSDLYYLRSCLRHLREFSEVTDDAGFPSIGGEALADNIDWLDCYIERLEKTP